MDREFTDSLLHTVRTTAGSDHQTLLHEVYAAVIQGNFDALADAVTDDVELNICGFEPLHGNWRGRKDVIEATRNNFAMVANQQPVIESIISQGDCVGVLLRESGVFKSTGQRYSIRAVQWFIFLDGKIKRIDQIVANATS